MTNSTATVTSPTDAIAAIVASIPTQAAYVAADRAGKAAIRSDVAAIVQAAIRPGGYGLPVAMAAQAALDAYAPAASAAPAFDWSDAIAVRVATLRLAADLLESGHVRPTDAPTDGIALGVGLITPDAIAAEGIAADAIRRASKRDLSAMLTDAVAAMPDGFVTIAQLRSAVADIAGDGYRPSGGAVQAALESVSGITGATFSPTTANRRAGAVISNG